MNYESNGNRQEAGVQLARLLHEYENDANTIIICISRQGIPVAIRIAQHLNIKLDILTVKEFVIPGTNERSCGAVTSDGEIHLSLESKRHTKKYQSFIEDMCRMERKRLLKQENILRHGRNKLSARNKNIILVDDGSQGGPAFLSAIRSIKKQSPKSIVIAVPVISKKTLNQINAPTDQVLCLKTPDYIDDICQEYRYGNHLDEISHRHMLWDFWDNSRRPLLRLKPHDIDGRPEYIRSKVISKNSWDPFTRDFSQKFIGWNLSIKVIHFSGYKKFYSKKPFRCHSFIRHNPFFGISYLKDKNLCIVRYIDNGKVKSWYIHNPTNLVLRDAGQQRKSLRIDNSNEQTFYIQLLNQGRQSTKPHISPAPSSGPFAGLTPEKLRSEQDEPEEIAVQGKY